MLFSLLSPLPQICQDSTSPSITHMLSLCLGPSVFLFIVLCSPLISLCVRLASLFFLVCQCLCLSALSRSHTLQRTQQTHHHPLNFSPAHNVVPHKKYASITTTVLTHTTHTQTYTERSPLSPKRHAAKYSWELLKSYKANMCGEHQALNLGSGITVAMSQLWFSSSCQVSLIRLLCRSFRFVSYSSLSLKTHRIRRISPQWASSPSRTRAAAYRCRFPDSNACSGSAGVSGCRQSLSCACETPTSVYFHLQG